MQREWQQLYGMDILSMDSGKKSAIPGSFTARAAQAARRFHQQIHRYQPTPLVRLSGLAGELGVKDIFVKDESRRFSLNAFKGPGGSYATFRILCERLGLNPETASLADFQTVVLSYHGSAAFSRIVIHSRCPPFSRHSVILWADSPK